MARPKKHTSEKLSKSLPPVRCTETDYESIISRAEEAGLSLTEYVRQMALAGQIVVRKSSADFSLLEELRYSGNNLNQLTKRFHTNGVEPQELRKALDAHDQLLRKVMGVL
ncbi:MAG: plasmid mobilization relaxosome protein MobC [Cytophagales bacterium]|nr:plasmid mobilization relaxosome protein MobC [Cytophagales bacterium]